ncbi:HXXEE domain-containing protein [Epilithonimonas sp.]|uniref:HXXEE domain-containing protein n=1 Tax=Epilithonimonas sp. TaxID=2894511 RepID=UPI0028B067C6|nr:HXXEE domain-containing protein [Epilithonimonas sp.]
MKFLLRHFYNISVFIGITILVFTFIYWNDLHYLSALALINLAVINFHFYEEFGFPGGFPYFANTIFGYKDSPKPDRFPLNQMSAFLTNWGTALVMYLPPVFFPDKIWLGLAPILFGGVAQLIIHGIVNNKMLKTWYNGGLATTLFGHVPVMILYIQYIETNNLVTVWDYVIGTVLMIVWYVVGIRIIINKGFENLNSPYPFDKTEMDKFHKAYKHLPYNF